MTPRERLDAIEARAAATVEFPGRGDLMNTRPLPPSCPTCGGEGALEADPADVTCPACHGTGEAPASLRVGVVAVACIGAAIVGGFIPAGWWLP